MSYDKWRNDCVSEAEKQFSARMSNAAWPGFTAKEQQELEDELHQETVGAIKEHAAIMADQI